MSFQIACIKNNPVDSNCFLLFDKAVNHKCLIVDPGFRDAAAFEEVLGELQLVPESVLLTHEHFDHIWGCDYLAGKYGVTFYASRSCAENIKSSRLNCSRYYDPPGFGVAAPVHAVEDRANRLLWNTHTVEFFAAPGHSDAGVCFVAGKYLFTGDTLIENLKTVTTLRTGSREKVQEQIAKLESLKGDGLTVCAGHGAMFQLDDYDLILMI